MPRMLNQSLLRPPPSRHAPLKVSQIVDFDAAGESTCLAPIRRRWRALAVFDVFFMVVSSITEVTARTPEVEIGVGGFVEPGVAVAFKFPRRFACSAAPVDTADQIGGMNRKPMVTER
jgi:hypothetical protein